MNKTIGVVHADTIDFQGFNVIVSGPFSAGFLGSLWAQGEGLFQLRPDV